MNSHTDFNTRFLTSLGEEEEKYGLKIALKILSIVLILAITIMFGFFPFFW